ncbi:alpha/beta fold hydrolase [Gemmatimonas sp.]|uniref:S9 family peptidase n=1 Tax=Gemmatimonas sp. TaxID=1962908 RepID=UPI0022CC6829|nr:alpha/beta fold hydrolase [Gemmatimonas sp.]MCZ8205307.1 alpha/beta fold hydrolase [Gemmatimonas sp.]
MTRTRALALGALTLVCASTLAAQGATPPTIDQLQSVVSPIGAGEPAVWSVDGTRLIYVGGDGLLASVGVNGGAPMRYAPALQDERQMERMLHAPSLGGASQLRRSPDGRMVTYVKGVAGGNDIFGFDIAAGTERRITRLSGHVRSYAFSPTGDRIALANDRNGSEDVYVVDVATGVATRLTSSPLYEGFPSFTPDGNRVIYTRLDSRWVDHEVFSIPAEGGVARLVLTDRDYFDYRQGAAFGVARVSPDGKTMLFRSQRSGWANYWLAPLAGGPPRPLAAEQADQSEARWSPDGSQVLFLSITNGTQSLKVAPAAGGAARTVVAPPVGMVSRAEWSPNGQMISYAFGTPTRAPDLFVVPASGGVPRRLTDADPGGTIASQLIEPEKVAWTNEGFTINAYLYKPRGLRAGDKAPVIMLLHGGPTSQFSDNYQLQPQFFASRGYVVIAPNVRGSSGYGKRFEDANNRDWGHGDLRDVLAGVTWAKQQAYVNPEKIGITGISYGGMLTMYATSFAPGVFQAAISGSGYGDVTDFHTVVPVLQHSQLLHYELGRWPSTRAVDSIYRRSSAIHRAKDATAPTMLIHGYGLDVLDTEYAAWKYARELAKHSKVVEYRKYPNETYYVYGRENTKAMLEEMLDFFDRYLKDGSVDRSAR